MSLSVHEILLMGQKNAPEHTLDRETFLRGNPEHPIHAIMRMDSALSKVNFPRHLQETLIQYWLLKVPQWQTISTETWMQWGQEWVVHVRKHRDHSLFTALAEAQEEAKAKETQSAKVLQNSGSWTPQTQEGELEQAA